MTNGEVSCRKERLAAIAGGAIFRCLCGLYHVRINGTTLQLTASQFDDTARLFKIVLGMVSGRNLSPESEERILTSRENKDVSRRKRNLSPESEERILTLAQRGCFRLMYEPHPPSG